MRETNRRIRGTAVFLRDGDDVGRALRKFKNKMEDSNKLKDLQRKEFYEKPTTMRKRKAGAAKARWKKKLEKDQLPKKMY
jgi:small subunit ribosomal protein S21